MLSVTYKITIGSDVYSSGDHAPLLELYSNASLNVPMNDCKLVLYAVQGLNITLQSPVSVELGYNLEHSLIFTGIVDSIDWGTERITINAVSSFKHLLTARFNQFFEKSKAGDIVSALCNQVGISSGTVSDGVEFSTYALGENQKIYDHLWNLAQQCGFDIYADNEDKLIFSNYNPTTTHQFQYGNHILSFTLDDPDAALTGVDVYGESPASLGQGAEASTWLMKKEVKGTSGDQSGVVISFIDPTVRTQENATKIAEAFLAAIKPKKRGLLKVIGSPEVQPGHAVQVTGMPMNVQNNIFKITSVTHTLHPKRGYITSIGLEEK